MSKRKPMHPISNPSAMSAAALPAHLAPGHIMTFGKVAAGKTVYDLLRITQSELRLMRPKRAHSTRNAGDEAWA